MIRRIASLAGMLTLSSISGCISHKVTVEKPIDINLHIMVDDRLQEFFDYQQQAAGVPNGAASQTDSEIPASNPAASSDSGAIS